MIRHYNINEYYDRILSMMFVRKDKNIFLHSSRLNPLKIGIVQADLKNIQPFVFKFFPPLIMLLKRLCLYCAQITRDK